MFDLVEVGFHSGSASRCRYQVDRLLIVQTDARLVHPSLCGALRANNLDGLGKDLLIEKMIGRILDEPAQALWIMGPISARGPADIDRIDNGGCAKDVNLRRGPSGC